MEALIDIGSSCNIICKSLCKRLGLTIAGGSQNIFGFNCVCTRTLGTVEIPDNNGMWQANLDFRVVSETT